MVLWPENRKPTVVSQWDRDMYRCMLFSCPVERNTTVSDTRFLWTLNPSCARVELIFKKVRLDHPALSCAFHHPHHHHPHTLATVRQSQQLHTFQTTRTERRRCVPACKSGSCDTPCTPFRPTTFHPCAAAKLTPAPALHRFFARGRDGLSASTLSAEIVGCNVGCCAPR